MIATRILPWFDNHGRHDLPWQGGDAYRVWLSEIMLQQTQVATVIPYFLRFVERLPSLQALAEADLDTVLALWSGLGYYRRARFLHHASQLCMREHGGALPQDFNTLLALPGIGRSTAGAILAQAHGLPLSILDGNVKRVLARYHGMQDFVDSSDAQRQLWTWADAHTPRDRAADYTQAIMDLGATVCVKSRPRCTSCPLAGDCIACIEGLTDSIPATRIRKAIPTRRTVMWLLRDPPGRVLLERRAAEGVWPRLWSLPESGDVDTARRSASRHARITRMQPLPDFRHTFSHFRLEVTPLLMQASAIRHAIGDNGDLAWYAPDRALDLGLPAPVRRLIASLGNIP